MRPHVNLHRWAWAEIFLTNFAQQLRIRGGIGVVRCSGLIAFIFDRLIVTWLRRSHIIVVHECRRLSTLNVVVRFTFLFFDATIVQNCVHCVWTPRLTGGRCWCPWNRFIDWRWEIQLVSPVAHRSVIRLCFVRVRECVGILRGSGCRRSHRRRRHRRRRRWRIVTVGRWRCRLHGISEHVRWHIANFVCQHVLLHISLSCCKELNTTKREQNQMKIEIWTLHASAERKKRQRPRASGMTKRSKSLIWISEMNACVWATLLNDDKEIYSRRCKCEEFFFSHLLSLSWVLLRIYASAIFRALCLAWDAYVSHKTKTKPDLLRFVYSIAHLFFW